MSPDGEAIGWLGRENKIRKKQEKHNIIVSLVKNESNHNTPAST